MTTNEIPKLVRDEMRDAKESPSVLLTPHQIEVMNFPVGKTVKKEHATKV
jgi:hypothetical protein